jgi:hypothetical protein
MTRAVEPVQPKWVSTLIFCFSDFECIFKYLYKHLF